MDIKKMSEDELKILIYNFNRETKRLRGNTKAVELELEHRRQGPPEAPPIPEAVKQELESRPPEVKEEETKEE